MFLLDFQSKVPIYEQIQTQILKFIDVGVLSPGDRLPSIRSLAGENGINPNTVAKAFSQLAQNGYIYNVPKKGYYVAEKPGEEIQKDRIRLALEPLRDSGIKRGEIEACLDDLYGAAEGTDSAHQSDDGKGMKEDV